MQIHELNKKPQTINEIDLVGPGSIFNVGKQVLKNPKAFINSAELGAAQSAAYAADAQQSAEKLANPGKVRQALGNRAYQVGGSVKPIVTTAQQLQKVRANPAVQQQVKNLTSQWIAQSQALKKTIGSAPIYEDDAAFDPRDVTDPKYATLYKGLQATGGTPTNPTPEQTAATETELEKKLTVWKNQFKAWSDPRLQVPGITMDRVRQDSVTAKMLDSAMANVAVAAQAGNGDVEKQAVEEYFNIAIAAIQAFSNNTEQRTPQSAGSSAGQGAAQAQDEVAKIQQELQRIGITDAQLSSLGKLMSNAAQGNPTYKNTGNPVLNTIADLAGMKMQ